MLFCSCALRIATFLHGAPWSKHLLSCTKVESCALVCLCSALILSTLQLTYRTALNKHFDHVYKHKIMNSLLLIPTTSREFFCSKITSHWTFLILIERQTLMRQKHPVDQIVANFSSGQLPEGGQYLHATIPRGGDTFMPIYRGWQIPSCHYTGGGQYLHATIPRVANTFMPLQ